MSQTVFEKLNLSERAVNNHWKIQDKRLQEILKMMGKAESWTVDEVQDVSDKLVEFGRRLGDLDRGFLLKNIEEVMTIMAFISSSKAIRLLSWIDENSPGISFRYIMHARHQTEWECGQLLIDRLRTIKAVSLLSEVFSPVRSRIIGSFLDADEDDNEDEDE